jgi:hypothetical protein
VAFETAASKAGFCDTQQGLINGLRKSAAGAAAAGDSTKAAVYQSQADDAENDALDAGCFVVD